MSGSEVAERAEAAEREISEADAWELRCSQEVAANRGLRAALLSAQEANLELRRRVLELERGSVEADQAALVRRLDLQEGDELVLRDGKPLLLRAPEKSGPAGGAASTIDAPGGVPGEENVGGE